MTYGRESHTWSYAVVEHGWYIRFIARGEFIEKSDIVDFSESILMSARVRGIDCVLVDKRALPPNLGSAGADTLRKRLANAGIGKLGLNIAGLGAEKNRDTLLLVEKVLNDQHINYRLFLNENEAVKWLEEQRDAQG